MPAKSKRLGSPCLLMCVKKAVVISVLALSLLALGFIWQRSVETYGQDAPGSMGLFVSQLLPLSLQRGGAEQGKLFNVPYRQVFLPASLNLVDLGPVLLEPSGTNDNRSVSNKSEGNFTCVVTKTSPEFHICVYEKKRDAYVSSRIIERGVWETHITKLIQLSLRRFPTATFIDLGANIGYFSLLAAKMGHQVIGVEPTLATMRRLRRSVQLNGLMDRMYVLHNAVDKTHRNVSMSASHNNQGALHVRESQGPQAVRTITMDEMLPLIATDSAIIKIDIEGHECRALAVSAQLFNRVYVAYIFMEWVVLRIKRNKPESACPLHDIQEMIDYLVKLGYHAHETRSGIELNPLQINKWQVNDIYWRHHRQPLLVQHR